MLYRNACEGCLRFAGYAGQIYCQQCEQNGTANKLEKERFKDLKLPA